MLLPPDLPCCAAADLPDLVIRRLRMYQYYVEVAFHSVVREHSWHAYCLPVAVHVMQ